jgi:hypothetical protein
MNLFSNYESYLFFNCLLKLRAIVKVIRGSHTNTEAFEKECVAEGIKPKKLILDTKIRWNSTADMLDRGTEMKRVT